MTTRRFRRTALVALALVLIQFGCHKTVHVAKISSTAAPPGDHPDLVLNPSPLPVKFVAYGDIRFTAVNRLTEANVSNSYARRAIVDAVAKLKPAFALISGDLVWRGADNSDWTHFDEETKPLRDAKVPILPTVGNHEYLSSTFVGNGRTEGLRNYFDRFPEIPHRMASPWYSAQYANCYFLMLDSEDDDRADSPQMKWVQSQLDSLPPEIEYVFVVLHRPAYTSAADAGHRQRLPEMDLAKMLEARQQKSAKPHFVVIAGHVHNYERYQKNGVDYIVSGGGGVHPHPLTRRADDLFHPANPNEIEFNYCVFTVDHGKLKFEMYRLSDERPEKFDLRDSFSIDDKR